MIDLMGIGSDVLKYYKSPRRGESKEKYIARVGINYATKEYGKDLVKWVGAEEGLGGGDLGGAATKGALSGVTTYLETGDVGKAGISAAKSGGLSYATSLAKGALSDTAFAGAAPYLGTAVGLGTTLFGDAPLEKKGEAVMKAGFQAGGIAAKAAGVAAWPMAVPGIALAGARYISAGRSSKNHLGLGYDPSTGKFSTDWGEGKGQYRETWKNMDPAARKKIAMSVKRESDEKYAAFNEFTQGKTPNEVEALKKSLGPDYFKTNLVMNEDQMSAFGRPDWDGNIKKLTTSFSMPESHLETMKLAQEFSDAGTSIEGYKYELEQFSDIDSGGQGDPFQGGPGMGIMMQRNLPGYEERLKSQTGQQGFDAIQTQINIMKEHSSPQSFAPEHGGVLDDYGDGTPQQPDLSKLTPTTRPEDDPNYVGDMI